MDSFKTSLTTRWEIAIALACIYAGAIEINNNLLFRWAEYDHLRNLVFIPAGLKLVLLMTFGWRAVFGIAIATAAVILGNVASLSLAGGLTYGVLSGTTAFVALRVLSTVLDIRYPWTGLSAPALACLALSIATLDALNQHVALTLIGLETLDDTFKDGMRAMLGRVLGTGLFMALAVHMKHRLASWSVEWARMAGDR
jgi:hypothetical protein